MPTSPLKRPSSAGGRLGRLLASLRPPVRAGPLPVQTGFPTSLADLVVKNHVRLRNPRRRHRPSAAPQSPAPPVTAALQQEHRRDEVVTVEDASLASKCADFSIRPEVLAVGGAVALALLVIWSKWLVAATTVASVTLFWIESVRSSASLRRRRRPEDPASPCGRGLVSPIREELEESEAGTPRPSIADSDRGSEVSSSLWDDSIGSRRKEKRRSLRKLIANKLRKGSKPDIEDKHPDAGGEEGVNAEPAGKTEEPRLPAPAAVDATTPRDAVSDQSCRRHLLVQGSGAFAFPSAALVPIILVGLVAGKLPAVALTVLCAVFFSSSVYRVPGNS